MSHPIVSSHRLTPPEELLRFFDDPPLLATESREDYDQFFSAIVAALKPCDKVAWLHASDYIDLSWEIRREKKIKANIIRSNELKAVAACLQSSDEGNITRLVTNYERKSRQWATVPKERLKYDKQLEDDGFTKSDIMANAFILGADSIDAIDRRIASYERRRMPALRALEQRDEVLARQIKENANSAIDAEFTEVAQEPA